MNPAFDTTFPDVVGKRSDGRFSWHHSLGVRLSAILGLTIGGLLLLGGGVLGFVVWPAFKALELTEARENTARAVGALRAELSRIDRNAKDYATWSEMWSFAREPDEEFRTQTFNPLALTNLDMDLSAAFAGDGGLVAMATRTMDQGSMDQGNVDRGSMDRAALGDPEPLLRDGRDAVTGIRRTEHGLVLLAARPILRSTGEGPRAGTFVMGRRLTPDLVEHLGAQAKVAFSVKHDGVPPPFSWPEVRERLRRGEDVPVDPASPSDRLISFAAIETLDGGEPVVLSVETPRRVVAIGRRTVLAAAAIGGGGGFLIVVLMAAVLHRTIMKPLRDLTTHVAEVGRTGRLPRRIGPGRRDEIGQLAAGFDTTVAQLAETRQRLLEQSFHGGMAEMASGVLHNVRNALSPLNVSFWALANAWRGAIPRHLGTAVAELGEQATPAERRERLAAYVATSIDAITECRDRSLAELDRAEAQMRHIERILRDHAAFGMARRRLEPVRLDEVVAEAVRMIPSAGEHPVTVRVQPGVAHAPPVLAHRVLLVQILDNLVANAVEALKASDGGVRTITVDAGTESADGGQGAVRLTVRDNGAGIAADVLPRIFERGFSTRRPGSGGLGLHWSANTVTAMGGRLWAESGGPGTGAAFHIVLTTAPTEEEAER